MTMFPMLSGYGVSLLAGAILSVLLLFVRMRKARLKAPVLCGALCAALGVAGARGYFILMQNVLGGYPMYGGVVSLYPYEHAMCGAVIGVCAGVWLCARLTRQKPLRMLDAMAPAGLLMICVARFGECFSDFGWGTVVEAAGWQRMPFAVMDMYDQWHWAVFTLEGALAAAVLVYILCRKEKTPGVAFSLALLWWAMTQVFCESFRAETLRWGFVRVQQAQCAVFALALMLIWGRGMNRKAMLRRLALFALCVGVVVFVEFALDKLNDIPNAALYALMAADLFVLGGMVQKIVLDKA